MSTKHITLFKLDNLSLLIVFKHLQGIILDLERCMEVMWGGKKLVLFTLYDMFANLVLKPVVT